jgi:hypothetical protein
MDIDGGRITFLSGCHLFYLIWLSVHSVRRNFFVLL